MNHNGFLKAMEGVEITTNDYTITAETSSTYLRNSNEAVFLTPLKHKRSLMNFGII